MGSLANAVGDPTEAAEAAADRPRHIRWVGWAKGAALLGFVSTYWTSTFAYADCLAFVAAALLPAAIVLIAFMVQDSDQWPYTRDSPPPRRLARSRIFVVLIFLGCPAILALFANQALDRSPGVLETSVVSAKHDSSGRRRRHYSVAFRTAHNGPFGRTALSTLWISDDWTNGAEPVKVGREVYQRVQPGRTRITLRVHRGLFGFPWYEHGSIAFSGLSARSEDRPASF